MKNKILIIFFVFSQIFLNSQDSSSDNTKKVMNGWDFFSGRYQESINALENEKRIFQIELISMLLWLGIIEN